jgi:hypothetical protein
MRELRLVKIRLLEEFSQKINDLQTWEKEIQDDKSISPEKKKKDIKKVSNLRVWLAEHLETIEKLMIIST